MELVSRQRALREGSKTYFTGKPCKHGHVAERYTSSRNCRECTCARLKQQRAADPEKFREYQRKGYRKNPEKYRERQRQWYAANPAKVLAGGRKWLQANPEYHRQWQRKNPGKVNARTVLYQQRKRDQICDCCTDEQREAAYRRAHREGLTVDHIIPVSKGGLHCMANFQLLSFSENCCKQARYDPLIEGIQYLQNLGLA